VNLYRQLEQAALALVYGLAMRVRNVVWRIQRPKLIGVRALIVRDQAVLLIRHRAGRQPCPGAERLSRSDINGMPLVHTVEPRVPLGDGYGA